MNQHPENYRLLIEQYLDGVLSPEEEIRVKALLDADPALHEEFRAMQLAIEATRYKGLQSTVADIRHNMLEEQNRRQPGKQKIPSHKVAFTRWTLRIAAGFLLLAGAFGIYKYISVSPESVFDNYYQTYELGRTRNTTQEPIDQAFQRQQWKEVIRLAASQPQKNNKQFFLSGIAFLESGNMPDAVRQFTTILSVNEKESTDYFNDEAEYFLALSYIRQGEPGKAGLLFRKIRLAPEHVYHELLEKENRLDFKVLSWKYSK